MARHVVAAEIAGTVFKLEVAAGASVLAGAVLIILESMKMEIPVEAPIAGKIAEVLVSEGQAIAEGQSLAVIEG